MIDVLVDMSVWSHALRRRAGERHPSTVRLERLIRDFRVHLIGPIRQELLSGVADDAAFDRLRERLAAFPDTPLDTITYETAARFYNRCRRSGVAGSQVDFLICAAAHRHGLAILTTDQDFTRYAQHLEIVLDDPKRDSA